MILKGLGFYLISDFSLHVRDKQTLNIKWCFQLSLTLLHQGCFCIAHYLHINISVDGARILQPAVESTKKIVEGENTTLRCVGVGYPPPLVQWSKLNGSLSDRVYSSNMSMSTNEGNVTTVTVDLIFIGAYKEDAGVYECLVSSLLNNVTKTITLIIQSKETFHYVQGMFSSMPYNQLHNLYCTLHGMNQRHIVCFILHKVARVLYGK